jgi:hypothetical protein
MMDNIIDGVSPHVNTYQTKYSRRVYADQWRWRMLEESNLPPLARLVALVVSLHDGLGEPRPTHKRIAMLTGLDERTVKAHLRRSCLWIPVIEPGRHRGQAAVYGLEIPGKTLDELSTILERGATDVPLSGERGATESPPTDVPLSEKAPHPMPPFAGERGAPGAPPLVSKITTLRLTREGALQGEGEKGASATTTRADDWKKAVATGTPPAEPKIDFKKDYDKLSEALFTTANGAMARGLPGLEVLSEPIRWLEGGCDFHLDVLPVIKARSAKAKPGSIRTWGYFGAAVFEARDARTAPPPEPNVVDKSNGKTYSSDRMSNEELSSKLAKIQEDIQNGKRT